MIKRQLVFGRFEHGRGCEVRSALGWYRRCGNAGPGIGAIDPSLLGLPLWLVHAFVAHMFINPSFPLVSTMGASWPSLPAESGQYLLGTQRRTILRFHGHANHSARSAVEEPNKKAKA